MNGRGEGEDREEAVAHPSLPMSFKARLISEGRNGSSDGETRELLKKQRQGVS